MATPQPVLDLVARSNRIGTDSRNTNYGGGNTSAKGTVVDPASGKDVDLVWVKGSGGDLGTLQPAGLAVLRLDRVHELKNVYRGVEFEDEIVDRFTYCLHGTGGAAPSIDTSMHALVDANHVDHLHPDAGIAIANSVDGEALTDVIFGTKVLWVPWRRPGFQLGLDIAAMKEAHPDAVGAILGGHGISAWGDTSVECEANSMWIIRTAEDYIAEHSRAEPFGAVIEDRRPLAVEARRARAAAVFPTLRGLASTDERMVGHFIDSDEVLEFLSSANAAELSARGTSCPDHYLRTKVTPMFVDIATTASVEEALSAVRAQHPSYRDEYRAYYDRNATADSPAIRGADPRIVLLPGVGMFSFGKDKHTARVAGEYFVNAIAAMRGAEGLSAYEPVPESEKFRIEYWALEEAKLARAPKPRPLATRVALVTGAGSGIGKAIVERLAAEGACVVVSDVDTAKAESVAASIGNTDVAIAVTADVTDEESIEEAVHQAVLAFGGVDLIVNNAGLSISRSLVETSVKEWDLLHNVMARGSFLVSRESAKAMIAQDMGGDIIYIASKNSVFAGPTNVAYSASKADQAHQVRLLAAELGAHGIRVNGINPDGIVQGSGLFANGWGAQRAATYGVPEEKLGEYYAGRTLLGEEVFPEDVANAVVALTAGELRKTTGMHVTVDSGVAAAFLR
ncbi:bifunctional aldolase/short-chain dehydrogenase [Mycetocola sp.]|uniref:bifunctional aldolase/short-chain dehydrogenase n=1 Tax=Mycetocola sp. TaxID=1871042 RepID=UPI003988A745